MADEVGSAALSSGQKIVEVSAELIKMLAPLLEKLIQNIYHNSVDGLNNVGEKIADLKSKGTVSNKSLFLEAQKANCGISTTNNILARDMETFAEKAKQYNIPVAVVGKGQTQSIEFLDRDKGIVEQITQEIVQERLHEAPQSVKCFSISENNVTAMKAAFEEHGIECQFMKAPDGDIKCVYPAEAAEQVAVIKEDYRKAHAEVGEHLDVQIKDNEIILEDSKINKSIAFLPTNKVQTMAYLQEHFGYSEAKADIAANKICRDLGLDREKFFEDTRPLDNLNALKTNIRYPSDDLTLREMRFDAVNFKDGGTTHIVIQNGDKVASLTPERMTEAEMKNICTNQLGMSEYQAEKAVQKSVKIDRQVKSKMEERAVGRNGMSHTINIERTSQNSFTISSGGKSKSYNLNSAGLVSKISRELGIPMEHASNIVEKAKKQSALQNRIQNTLKKKPTAPDKPKIKLNESKGLKH